MAQDRRTGRSFQELEVLDELEVTMEAVRSTNAALEAMRAEVQANNEELRSIEDELRQRNAELDEVQDFLESLLSSHFGGLVLIDRDLRIRAWNDQSAELWGIRPDEAAGQHFLNLDIGLPVEELRQPIHAVLAGEVRRQGVELAATNRRGQDLRCQVALTPLQNRHREVCGVILSMEESRD